MSRKRYIYWGSEEKSVHQFVHQLKGKLFQVMQSYTMIGYKSAQKTHIKIVHTLQKTRKIGT